MNELEWHEDDAGALWASPAPWVFLWLTPGHKAGTWVVSLRSCGRSPLHPYVPVRLAAAKAEAVRLARAELELALKALGDG